MTEAERRQLLVEWNGARTDYPRDKCIQELFEAQVKQTPGAVAVVFEDRQLTYQELNCRANQLAHYLRKLRVKPEVPVGICMERSAEMIVGLLGILKTGGAYVPLDPTYPKERLAFMLRDTQAPVLLTQRRLVRELPEQGGRVVCLDEDWEVIAQESIAKLDSGSTPDDLAYVIYTSGSTGQPKGVQICHRSVSRLLERTRPLFGFNEHDVWTVFHSCAFDFSVWEIWGALLQGGRLVIVPREVAQSPAAFNDLLRRERVTVLNQTPSAMRQLIEARRQASGSGQEAGSSHPSHVQPEAFHDLNLRLIICGGEAFPPELVSPILEWNVPVWNFYGPTETTVWATINPVAATRSERNTIPIGRPIGDREVYLLDRNLQPVPVGVLGELHISGAGLARGYLRRPELTAEKFIPNPFSNEPGARLYKTGDLARYLPDGNIEFLGRIDQQVKIRGFRVESGEIEAVLCQHAGVREAVVVARDEEVENAECGSRMAEDQKSKIENLKSAEKRLVAYVVPHQEQTLAVHELRSFLKQKLPEYMVPSAFVFLDALPLTPNGKVDRRSLPAPDPTRSELDRPFVSPRTPVEEELAKIWAEVLGVKQAGVSDDFF